MVRNLHAYTNTKKDVVITHYCCHAMNVITTLTLKQKLEMESPIQGLGLFKVKIRSLINYIISAWMSNVIIKMTKYIWLLHTSCPDIAPYMPYYLSNTAKPKPFFLKCNRPPSITRPVKTLLRSI